MKEQVGDETGGVATLYKPSTLKDLVYLEQVTFKQPMQQKISHCKHKMTFSNCPYTFVKCVGYNPYFLKQTNKM